MPRWTVVLFDLDGTLVNTVPMMIAAYQQAVRAVVGIELSEERVREFLGRPLLDNCRDLAGDKAAAVYSTYVRWTVDYGADLLLPHEGMAELLTDLTRAGLRIGICTDKRPDAAETNLRAGELQGVIPILTTFDDAAGPKPHPSGLRHSLSLLGASPEQAVYVGDGAVDMRAAKAARMSAIAVTWGTGTREELESAEPDEIVDTPAELREVLLG
ncbi:HAD family hydrolase [Enemella sp. A6]|uniref:HAD family hydrolase n=1 Tax=Enemella sp. A6 TaxID=3440152 RepID=UPI003EB8FA63